MAFSIQQDNPDCDGFAVVDDDTGELESCHQSEADAQAQVDNLNANGDEDDMPDDMMRDDEPAAPRTVVRDNLTRSLLDPGAVGVNGEGDGRTLFGYMARFNSWTEINNPYEGRFLERIAPGAFAKTLREGGKNVKILFNHGKDPSIGMKPLGPVTAMREDDQGLYYEVELLDAPYIQDVAPAAKAGLLGSSFQFSVPAGRDEWVDRPKRSAYNPEALPERTIRECRLYEGGPVTFPAYADATAGVRSLAELVSGEIRLTDEQRDQIVQAVLRSLEDRTAGIQIDPPAVIEPDAAQVDTELRTSDIEVAEPSTTDNTDVVGDVGERSDDMSDAATEATEDAPADEGHPSRTKTTLADRRARLLQIRGVTK